MALKSKSGLYLATGWENSFGEIFPEHSICSLENIISKLKIF